VSCVPIGFGTNELIMMGHRRLYDTVRCMDWTENPLFF
jgi:hypothetical protein